MKKILLSVTLLLSLTMLVGCANDTTMIEHIYFQGEHTYWQGLHMYIPAESVTPTGSRLFIINNSSELYFGFGEPFNIEKYVNGSWEQVPFIDDVFWTMPLFIIEPMTTTRGGNLSWEHMHGQLQPGQYRIMRNFMEYDRYYSTPRRERGMPHANLYATFVITE